MWCLLCPYLFLIPPYSGAFGDLCFWNVTFPGYLHLYFNRLKKCTESGRSKLLKRFTSQR